MRHVASIKAHAIGIQWLRWFDDELLLSSGGNELFVWRVRTMDSAYPGLAVVCEAVLGDKSWTGDARFMDFDVGRCSPVKGMLVTLAFSNSTVKTYRYSPDGGFERFAEASYTGACLTQARHVGMCRGKPWLLTASTDGHVAMW